MTLWQLWPATNGPALTTDSVTTDLGVEFFVTQSGCSLTGYRWWLPAGGNTFAVTVRLYSTTNGTTGTLIPAGTVTSGTLTAGSWNTLPVTPVALTASTHYRAVVTYAGTNDHYGATSLYWSSGAGSAGITNGPLTAPNSAGALNNGQGSFNEPSTAGFSASTFNQTNYWLDVTVDDGAGTVGVGSVSRGFHPGRGPTRARFWQTPKSRQVFLPAVISGTATLTGAGSLGGGDTYDSTYDDGFGGAVPSLVSATADGTRPTAFHPGRGPTRARFRQTRRSTEQIAAGAITLNGTATLTGAGVMADTPVTIVAGAPLTGAGTLAALVTQLAGVSLAGAGTLAAAVTESAAAALTGAGTLASPVVQAAAATLTGAGTLAAPVTQGAGSVLTGAGTLTAATAGTISGTATLTGAGTLTAPAVQAAGTTLTGAGSLTAPNVQRAGTTLTGAGALASPAVQAVTAALAGAGTLTAAGTVAGGTISGTATLTGAGSVTAKTVQGVTAQLTAAGALSALATLRAVALLTGSGLLTAVGTSAGPVLYGTARHAVMAVPAAQAGDVSTTEARAVAGAMTIPRAEGGQFP